MATREVMARRRGELRDHVRESIRSGVYAPGTTLPSQREFGVRFDLSRDTVQTVLHELIDEGVLASAPRRGVWVTERVELEPDSVFVMMARRLASPDDGEWLHQQEVRRGFERQISRRGGVSLVRFDDPAPLADEPIGGLFSFVVDEPAGLRAVHPEVPRVWYGTRQPILADGVVDQVRFDNLGGAREAARHLLRRGHRRIGFVSRFPHDGPEQGWAIQREQGWAEAVRLHSQDASLICFHPTSDTMATVSEPEWSAAVAQELLSRREEIDALVAVDDWVVAALLTAWQRQGLPGDELPAMVGFEGLPEAQNPAVSSVQLPWDRVGELAADLLWQRAAGQISGGGVLRTIPMELATRLSSRRGRAYDTLAVQAARPPA